jgi:hypothetical protein
MRCQNQQQAALGKAGGGNVLIASGIAAEILRGLSRYTVRAGALGSNVGVRVA